MASTMTIGQALRTPAELRSSEGQTPPLPRAMRAAFYMHTKPQRRGASTLLSVNGSCKGPDGLPTNTFSLRSLRLNLQAIAN